MFVFEHNSFNPLTRHAVNTCPFDENAILIPGRRMKSLFSRTKFRDVELKYRIFFPHLFSRLRGLEPFMAWLPLGAILCQRQKARGGMTEQFIRFVLVGVVNTFVGLSVIFAMKYLLNSGDVVANGVAYLVGLTVSFLLNRSWTFSHRGRIRPAVIRFALVFLVAYGFNLATVLMLIHWVGVNTYFAQAAGLPPYMIVFFLLSKFFAFRDDSLARPRDYAPSRQ